MKFLLTAVNAKYIHSNPAIYSLRAYAGVTYEQHIELAEYTINHSLQSILTGIYEKKPDVIGFSCYIWNIRMIEELLEELPKIMPRVPIWVGGPEVTYRAAEFLEQHPSVQGVMVGEGEATFLEVLRYYLEEPISLSQIAGIVYRDEKGRIIQNEPRELTNLDRLPFLYHNLEPFTNRIIYYETGRGCPYRCSYCLSSIDKTVRLRSFSVVREELQFFLDHQVTQVKFVDRTFNCNRKHAMDIWQYLIEHDNGVTNFHFEIEADILSEEELALLAKARPGLFQMEIGVQTANPETLHEIRRTARLDRIEHAVAQLKRAGNIHVHLDLIAGLPFEDYESFGHSFDTVYAMEPEQLQLGFLKVLWGSYMQEKAKDYELKYLTTAPYEVLSTKWLSYGDVVRLKRVEEMVELYYNSNQFTTTLPLLEAFFARPFEMYQALADFYEDNGYFVTTPSRIYRYQVLLDFILSIAPGEHLAYFKEALTYDIYLRENAKSRPDFAPDLQEYKNVITDFYREEAENHRFLPESSQYDARQLQRMTHLEVLQYPVFSKEKMAELKNGLWEKEESYFVLFDYASRNPLTYEARVVVLPLNNGR
ncbi:MAG: B12-binding domain-containing radical SAM protein [Clostridiales bacterium]|nr:B12-binding domain-containing radical SAM protein [Clostridiales bacterium]